jgi:hypothetical protein
VPRRGHPSGQPVQRGRVGQRGLAALVVRARRRVRLGLGHPLLPAAPAGRLVPAVPKGRPAPAPRLPPEDRRVLAGLVRLEGQPVQLGLQGQLRQQALADLAGPSKPPARSSRWQQGWSPSVASALPPGETRRLRSHVDGGQAATIVGKSSKHLAETSTNTFRLSARLRCKGMSSPAPSAAHVLECTSVKFSVHEQRDVKLSGQRRRTGLLQH